MSNTIPVFFACDDNYLPYLSVALKSIQCNSSKHNDYDIYILHSGINEKSRERIERLACDNFSIRFCDVDDQLKSLCNKLHMRDYYTRSTYYRMFIAEMFPECDKALYLDSDIIALDDIAKLYNYELGDRLVGAVADETVSCEPVFRNYTQKNLGIAPSEYFNAGILVMNLKQFRTENFYDKFSTLIGQYKFTVAQDQDYLNTLCKGRVRYLSHVWNKMPIPTNLPQVPKLIHYNLTRKPWHYADVLYGEYFWKYAELTDYFEEISNTIADFGEEKRKADLLCEQRLVALAAEEAENPQNYYNTYIAKQSGEKTWSSRKKCTMSFLNQMSAESFPG